MQKTIHSPRQVERQVIHICKRVFFIFFIYNDSIDYIIQVDGDLILGRHFIADHINFAKEKCIAKGRRVCLSQKETDRLLKEKSLKVSIFLQGTTMREHGIRIPFYNQLFSPKEKATGDGVGGGNMAYWKADALAINGYNMDIQN